MDRIDHKVLNAPFTYEIVYFSYDVNVYEHRDSTIELHLERDGLVKKLRFTGPQELKIEEGFPQATGGMFFEDVSSHGLDGLTVYVGDFEATTGSITFWARSVELF
ncbi:hypothetical protein [Vibrio sagamiensis]|uniref:Uncharacterized protein n=1 Tax=Vibrio sagamiensis NBRC 104589 TaxID=1219064 RepID=A0A511QMA5_9VIBR|nr:hypothetical protein [Vibrio sagamiensis]PNQ54402.1 hypothetical protein C1141_16050 [Vibrio agarivorans]GEM77642.1 hypothetical protein VSA01S_37540 [Vibrio sagamiensis NBRC 104589]